MIRILLLFASFSCISFANEVIEVNEKDHHKYGCDYSNFDYFQKKVSSDRFMLNNEVIESVSAKQAEFYDFMKKNVPTYHYFRDRSITLSGWYFDKVLFDFEYDRVSFYISGNDDSQKVIGFCFEGNYNSQLAEKFLSKKSLDSLHLKEDGDFYIASDGNFSVIEIVVDKGEITKLYIYLGYD